MFLIFKLVGKVVSTLLSVVMLGMIATAGYVLFESKQDQRDPSQAILVLGASQFNGTPSPVLANRLDHAYELAKAAVAPFVITVGGKQPGDRFTEAEAGQQYLADKGVDRERLLVVPTGSDTFNSLKAVAQVARKHGISFITIVSDPAHVGRAKLIAQDLGMQAVVSPTRSGPGSDVNIDYVIRETGGILYYYGWGRWRD